MAIVFCGFKRRKGRQCFLFSWLSFPYHIIIVPLCIFPFFFLEMGVWLTTGREIALFSIPQGQADCRHQLFMKKLTFSLFQYIFLLLLSCFYFLFLGKGTQAAGVYLLHMINLVICITSLTLGYDVSVHNFPTSLLFLFIYSFFWGREGFSTVCDQSSDVYNEFDLGTWCDAASLQLLVVV